MLLRLRVWRCDHFVELEERSLAGGEWITYYSNEDSKYSSSSTTHVFIFLRPKKALKFLIWSTSNPFVRL